MGTLSRIGGFLLPRHELARLSNPNIGGDPLSHITFVDDPHDGFIEILTDFDRTQPGHRNALKKLCKALKEKFPDIAVNSAGDKVLYDAEENRVCFSQMGGEMSKEKQTVLSGLEPYASGILGRRQQSLLGALHLQDAPPEIESLAQNVMAMDFETGRLHPGIAHANKVTASFAVEIDPAFRKDAEEAAYVLRNVVRHNGYHAAAITKSHGAKAPIDLVFWGTTPDIKSLTSALHAFTSPQAGR